VCGPDAAEKARACGDIIIERVRLGGYALARTEVELLGAGAALPGGFSPEGPFAALAAEANAIGGLGGAGVASPREVVLRVSAWDPRKDAIERFCREFSPIITSGPPGVTGYAGSRPKPRPVMSYWPSMLARSLAPSRVEARAAADLASAPRPAKEAA
jgi:hypothetical protein